METTLALFFQLGTEQMASKASHLVKYWYRLQYTCMAMQQTRESSWTGRRAYQIVLQLTTGGCSFTGVQLVGSSIVAAARQSFFNW